MHEIDRWTVTQPTDDDDTWRAESSDGLSVLVIPDGATARMRFRRALAQQSGELRDCLWAELDGVRLYVTGTAFVLTKRDMKP